MPENDKFFRSISVSIWHWGMTKNPDVEQFLKKSAIEFTKKNQSITYLVVSAEDVRLLGYFTLAIKPLTVRGEAVSNTVRRKLLRISELDKKSDTYTMSAYPVAQLGKNFSENAGNNTIEKNQEKKKPLAVGSKSRNQRFFSTPGGNRTHNCPLGGKPCGFSAVWQSGIK